MPEGHVLQIFIGICDGLKAFHEAKPEPLAHRDLKTANICMSDSMEPIIVDLGSATLAREQICGQPDAQRLQDQAEERCSIVYRAPELFNVQSYCMIDERTDIWVMLCVLPAHKISRVHLFSFLAGEHTELGLRPVCAMLLPLAVRFDLRKRRQRRVGRVEWQHTVPGGFALFV